MEKAMTTDQGTIKIWRTEIITPQEFIGRELASEIIVGNVRAWFVDDHPIPARKSRGFIDWASRQVDGRTAAYEIIDIEPADDDYIIRHQPVGGFMLVGKSAVIFVKTLTNKPKGGDDE